MAEGQEEVHVAVGEVNDEADMDYRKIKQTHEIVI